MAGIGTSRGHQAVPDKAEREQAKRAAYIQAEVEALEKSTRAEDDRWGRSENGAGYAPGAEPARDRQVEVLIPSPDIERETDVHERAGIGSDLDGHLTKGALRSTEAIPGRIRQG
jgi:hypothetical protein